MKLKIQGKGGYGSSSYLANDAIVGGAHFVTAVQTIISRRLSLFDIGVITSGSFDGAGTFNVIKDSVELEGDIRYMTDETKETIERVVKRLVKGLETEFDVGCELTYPPLYNNPELTEKVSEALKNAKVKEITEVKEVPPMGLPNTLLTMLKNFLLVSYILRVHQKALNPPTSTTIQNLISTKMHS